MKKVDQETLSVDVIQLSVSFGYTSPQWYQGNNEISSVKLSYHLKCSENYYGSTCEVFCMETDNASGHYVCDINGTKHCKTGYSHDSNCTKGIYKIHTQIHVISIILSF